MNNLRAFLILAFGLLLLAACGGTSSFSLGGSISGLGEGKGISLTESVSGQSVSAVEDGSFVFAQKLNRGASYKVEIGINPAAQGCVVKNGEGVIADANVLDVEVLCGDSGTIDESFGDGGVFIEPMAVPPIEISSVAVQDDGKILAAGEYYDFDARLTRLVILRTDSDGILDPSFASGGKFESTVDDWQSGLYVRSLANGDVLAGGTSSGDFLLAKLDSHGQPDPTFGAGGFVSTDFDGSYDELLAVFPEPDGGYLAVGGARVGGADTIGMVRYAADGSLSTEFGTGGKLSIACPIGAGSLRLSKAIRQPDGKIVLVGTSWPASDNSDLALARINADGSVDTDFGSSGWVSIDYGGELEYGYDLALQGDGKIVAVGYQRDDGDYRAMAVLVNADGSVDTDFGDSGFVFTDFGGEYDRFSAVAVQQDGKIVLAGSKWISGESEKISLVRLMPDGSFDGDFSDGGMTVAELDGGDDYPKTLLIQPDGRILIGGGRWSQALLMTRFWQ